MTWVQVSDPGSPGKMVQKNCVSFEEECKGGSVSGGRCYLLLSTILPCAPCFLLFFSCFYRFLLVHFVHLCSLFPLNFLSCSVIISLAPFPDFWQVPAPSCNFLCCLLPDYDFLAPWSLGSKGHCCHIPCRLFHLCFVYVLSQYCKI